jgi:Zn-dependent M32 family carboxypeptidase
MKIEDFFYNKFQPKVQELFNEKNYIEKDNFYKMNDSYEEILNLKKEFFKYTIKEEFEILSIMFQKDIEGLFLLYNVHNHVFEIIKEIINKKEFNKNLLYNKNVDYKKLEEENLKLMEYIQKNFNQIKFNTLIYLNKE